MRNNYLFQKGYRDNEKLRESFNMLANKIYGLDFEDWYQNGYWKDNYIPYSIVDGEKVVANASVNNMEFICDGKRKHYIQLGTVMTDEMYRNQGLSRFLIEEIFKNYKNKVDGIYLFANDSVLDFYPRFGFRKSKEYLYSKTVQNIGKMRAVKMQMRNSTEWKVLENAIKNSTCNSSFYMENNLSLTMFHITKFMQESVYYIEEQETYVIAEIEQENLIIHNLFSKNLVNMDTMIDAFGNDIRAVTLGFTPLNCEEYIKIEVKKEDTTLFIMGTDFDNFTKKGKMFPTLSHA